MFASLHYVIDTSWYVEAEKLTCEDIAKYLCNIKLEKYSQYFVEQDIGGDIMLDIVKNKDHKSLEELGINTHLNRVKVITKFKSYVTDRVNNVGLEET